MVLVMLDKRMLGPGLEVSPIITGLWQVADMERDGDLLDPEHASDALAAYLRDGFDTFDMADHYGSAELIAGRLVERGRQGAVDMGPVAEPRLLTKWCPQPGVMTGDAVRAAVEERLERMGVDVQSLMEFEGD